MNQMHQEIEFSDIQCTFRDKDLIGSGTYAKVFKGKIRGVDVAIKVPNLEKILPAAGTREDSGSSPSSFISLSESDAKLSTGPVSSSDASAPVAVPQKPKRSKRKVGFGFFRRNQSAPTDLSQLAIGGAPASLALDTSEDGTARYDGEEFESFGDDGAEDSTAETHSRKREGGREGADAGAGRCCSSNVFFLFCGCNLCFVFLLGKMKRRMTKAVVAGAKAKNAKDLLATTTITCIRTDFKTFWVKCEC
jgi:hypothetical protein